MELHQVVIRHTVVSLGMPKRAAGFQFRGDPGDGKPAPVRIIPQQLFLVYQDACVESHPIVNQTRLSGRWTSYRCISWTCAGWDISHWRTDDGSPQKHLCHFAIGIPENNEAFSHGIVGPLYEWVVSVEQQAATV